MSAHTATVYVRRWGVSIVSALSLCAASLSAQRATLRGTVVTPDRILPDAVVVVESGRILYVGHQSPASTDIEVGGVIFPGLIDLHNHLTWNVLPRWTPPRLYSNRFEWQEDPEYLTRVSGVHYALVDSLGCLMNQFAEVKAIMHGATSVVGGLINRRTYGAEPCVLGLARNLELASELAGATLNGEALRNVVFPFELRECEEAELRGLPGVRVCSPWTRAATHAVAHLGEGKDAPSRREFRMARRHGFLAKGFNVTHGIPLNPEQYRVFDSLDVGLVWSPRSNLVLYGQTADVRSATTAGVHIAIAPDWSPTGSEGMLDEIAYVDRLRARHTPLAGVFTDGDVVRMATVYPAQMSGYGTSLGRLEAGFAADLIVLRARSNASVSLESNARHALLRQTPADLLLVMIGARAVYGDRGIMTRLGVVSAASVNLSVCGENRVLSDPTLTPQQWTDAQSRLRTALRNLGSSLSDLVVCAP